MSKFALLSYEFKESMLIALRAIRANKIRSSLTMLGIFIGVTVVVLMTTAIKGIDNSFQQGISSLGSDVLYVQKWAWFSGNDWWKMRNRRPITMEDFERFKDLVKLPLATSPTLGVQQSLKYQNRTVDNIYVDGSDQDYIKERNFAFDQGRFFTESESKDARNVVILGSEIANDLFPLGNAMDNEIKVGPVTYKVIGVLTKQGSYLLGDFNPDNMAYIPIETVFKYFMDKEHSSLTIQVRAASTALLEDTKDETEEAFRKVRGLGYSQEDDFSINQQEGMIDNYNKVVGVIQIAGLFITGLSLFVGAIGIMNIMFVSVKERTKEIGLRKAIGARKRTILAQFLLESTFICLVGGIAGLIAAILLSYLVNQFIPTSVQYGAVVIAIVVSLITGLISGFAPAYTAAKMDPVEALRFE
ncbi:MAG: ABC transporter permease [Ignavibacteriaceae bacterium]|jgi:putative ABC transport system permease protein